MPHTNLARDQVREHRVLHVLTSASLLATDQVTCHHLMSNLRTLDPPLALDPSDSPASVSQAAVMAP